MSTVTDLNKLKTFLSENVCTNIKLKKPSDNDVDKFELVNPAVHIGWIPPKGFLPDEIQTDIPCLIVGLDDGEDDGQNTDIKIRISAMVYNPGQHNLLEDNTVECIPNFQGYIDLINLIDRTKAELLKNQIIDGLTIQYPVKWGMYQEIQPYPYWYGWVSFSLKDANYQPAKLVEKYL